MPRTLERLSREEMTEEIAATFEKGLVGTENRIRSSDLCLVMGGAGIGKSMTFAPTLEGRLTETYNSVILVSAQDSTRRATLDALPKTDQGVIILDEAFRINREGNTSEHIAEFLGKIHQRGYRIIPIFQYNRSNLQLVSSRIKNWEIAERYLEGSVSKLDLGDPRLDTELAANYLVFLRQKFMQNATLLDYILKVVPHKFRFFNQVATCVDVPDVITYILSDGFRNVEDEVTNAEYQRCLDQVRKDRNRLKM